MSRKHRKNIVFSTDPDFQYEYEKKNESVTLPPEQQQLKLLIDRKSRKGKEVTIIRDFCGTQEEINKICKKIKTKCATGGSVKNNEIIIQGNCRDKIKDILLSENYKIQLVGN